MSRASNEMSQGGRYKRYKIATEQLADWLVKTANECADITLLVASLQTDFDCTLASAGGVIDLRTGEFLALANAILKAVRAAVHGITVPQRILHTVKKVIRLRFESHDRHATTSEKADGSLSASDESHYHFITVLERVQAALNEAFDYHQELERRAFDEAVFQRENADLDTVFAKSSDSQRIDVDEECLVTPHSQEKLETRQLEAPQKVRRVDLSKSKIKLAKEADDLAFVAWCHLADLNDVKKLGQETIEQLRRGEISIFHALNTIDVAMELMKCSDETFGALNPELDSHSKLMGFLGFELKSFPKEPVIYIVKKGSDPTSKASTRSAVPPNVVELLFPIGAMINESFQKSLSRYKRNKEKYEKETHDQAALSKMETATAREKGWRGFHEFCKVLQDNVATIYLHTTSSAITDKCNLAEGLIKDPDRTWLNVSCELHLDVIDVLGQTTATQIIPQMLESRLEKVLRQLQMNHALVAEKHWDSTAVADSAANLKKVTENANKAIKMLRLKTPAANCGDFSSPLYEEQRQQIIELENTFFGDAVRVLPVLAMSEVYFLERQAMGMACANANISAHFHAATYLYKAGLNSGLIKNEWKDIELVASSHAQNGQWMPEYVPNCRPTEFAAGLRKAIGLDLHAFYAAMRGRHEGEISTNVLDRGRPLLGSRMALEITEGFKRQKTQAVKTSACKVLEIMLHDMLVERRQSDSGTQTSEPQSFSSLELLAEFKLRFGEEEAFMAMDLSNLLTQCGGLFQSLQKRIAPKSGRNNASFAHDIINSLPPIPPDMAIFIPEELNPFPYIMNKFIDSAGDNVSKAGRELLASERIQGPKVYELDEEQEAKRADELELFDRAGTSIMRAGKIVALYHPKLMMRHLEEARAWKSEAGCVNLPLYMVYEEAEAKELVDEKNTVEDTQAEASGSNSPNSTDSAESSGSVSGEETEQNVGETTAKQRKKKKNKGKKTPLPASGAEVWCWSYAP